MNKTVEQIYERFMSDFGFDMPGIEINPETLRETGVVEETEKIENDTITKTLKYVSNDGTTQITQTIGYNKNYLINKENREIRKQIAEAVAQENYELAAELKGKLRKK